MSVLNTKIRHNSQVYAVNIGMKIYFFYSNN